LSDPYSGRCGSCAAFTRVRDDPDKGKVGECALEVFPPPVKAFSTCAKYRPKGSQAPTPKPRAAGEPRRWRPGQSSPPPARRESVAEPVRIAEPLPKEIDIDMDIDQFRRVLREVLAEELGLSRPAMGKRWHGGELVLKPGDEATQEKRVPIEGFFHKIVMVRDKLRVLEQKINTHPGLSDEEKVQIQGYITACYGSLTTFNLLFADRDDWFAGQGKRED
jgi:hypothetical protein